MQNDYKEAQNHHHETQHEYKNTSSNNSRMQNDLKETQTQRETCEDNNNHNGPQPLFDPFVLLRLRRRDEACPMCVLRDHLSHNPPPLLDGYHYFIRGGQPSVDGSITACAFFFFLAEDGDRLAATFRLGRNVTCFSSGRCDLLKQQHGIISKYHSEPELPTRLHVQLWLFKESSVTDTAFSYKYRMSVCSPRYVTGHQQLLVLQIPPQATNSNYVK